MAHFQVGSFVNVWVQDWKFDHLGRPRFLLNATTIDSSLPGGSSVLSQAMSLRRERLIQDRQSNTMRLPSSFRLSSPLTGRNQGIKERESESSPLNSIGIGKVTSSLNSTLKSKGVLSMFREKSASQRKFPFPSKGGGVKE